MPKKKSGTTGKAAKKKGRRGSLDDVEPQGNFRTGNFSPSTLPRAGSSTNAAPAGRLRADPNGKSVNGRPPPRAGGGGIQRNTRKGSMFGKTAEPKDIIKGVQDISKAPWYVGNVTRVECDKAVLAGNLGDWLVRMSSSGQEYVICVNDSGECQNFKVRINGQKVVMGGVTFDTVMDCLHYLRSNPITGKSGRLYYLAKPCSEFPWYVGAMAKDECNKMVLAAGKSDYLVRLASDKKDYVLCLNQGNGTAKNCKIYTGGMKNSFTLGKTTESTMEDLLETLKDVAIPTNDGSANLYLRKPAAKAAYYAGQMTRADCEAYVKKSATGDYLIRQNQAGDKYVLVVNDHKNILNFIISQKSDGKFEFGGLPHDSLEMIIRYLKKAPLASKTGGQVFINRPAPMTNADDMIADVEFGFGGNDSEEEEEPSKPPPRRSLTRSSFGNALPTFGSDDEEDDEDEDEEMYDMPSVEKFQPFRVKSTREITGVCPAGVGLFVIAKKGDDSYLAVYSGAQVEVPVDAVEKESEFSRMAVTSQDEEDDEDDEDNEEEGDAFDDEEEEDEEDAEERKARIAEETEKKKAEIAAELEAKKAEALAKIEAESAEEEARMAAEMEAAAARLAALEDEDEEGFGGFGDEEDEEEDE